MSRNVALGII